MDSAVLYWIWLRTKTPPSSAFPALLLNHFGSPEAVYRATEEELRQVPGIRANQVFRLADKDLEQTKQILDSCAYHDIGLLTMQDPRYPEALRRLPDAPLLLFCHGKMPDFNKLRSFSVVGTRKMSDYGKRMTYAIAYGLAAVGMTIVSGLALGNDAMAAAGAIAAGGTTVAVLGCGIGRVYPRQHVTLYNEVVRRGVALSEYLPGEEPEPAHFPERNRIIAALGQGLLVTEAGQKSGALITAKLAAMQEKPIFALPGDVDRPESAGTNLLIKQGAFLTRSAADILDGLSLSAEAARLPESISPTADVMARRLEIASGARPSAVLGARQGKVQQPISPPDDGTRTERRPLRSPDDPVFQKITPLAKEIYFRMPTDREVLPDELANGQYPLSTVLGYLSLLEVASLVSRCSGGKFRRL